MNDFSCYTNSTLTQLRDKWNMRHPDAPIRSSDPREIHKQLEMHLRDTCSSNEACWLKQSNAFGGTLDAKKIENQSFAPEHPKEWNHKPNAWLSSVDITKVMKQYESAYHCFEFLGPSPIDFDKKEVDGECVWQELCSFQLAEMQRKGKFKIGIIFNTDVNSGPGEHWISLFINLKTKLIFFFDSTGDPMPPEVKRFIRRVVKQGKHLSPPIAFTVDDNEGAEHQHGDTECGVYSLFFIVNMLEDKTTKEYLKTHLIRDEEMQKFRKIYFNDPSLL